MMQNNLNNANNDNEEDVSMYYPDGDAEHIARDDHDEAFLNETIKKKKKIRRRNGRLKKSQIAMIVSIFVIYALVLVVAAWMIFYKPAQPTVEELPFDITPMEPSQNVVSDPNKPPLTSGDDPVKSPSDGTVTEPVTGETEQPASSADEYVIKEGVYNILVVGHDDAALLADVTMIVNVNTKDNAITVMQIPRDTFISLNVPTNRANAAFNTFYNQCYSGSYDATVPYAIEELEKMYEKSLCINIHHTAVLSLAGFQNIVNIMGGVGVYLPEGMYYEDPEQNLYINIGSGYQWLNGYQAECFVRFRSGYTQGDLGRVSAQKIFLTALFEQAKSTVKSASVSKLTEIATEISKYLTTNLSVSDLMFYAKAFLNIDMEDISLLTIPGNMERSNQYYVVNRAATLKVINQYFNIYEREISDSIFDRNGTFNLYYDAWISEVYYAGSDYVYDNHIYTGDSINEDLFIPRN
ncbi:MAG: LCP family protein [Clostridia bacterium]|nr:LCP family protein [Clostridia bacterium]MBQ9996084.1 LCP family protein [Clostridia bacterium]